MRKLTPRMKKKLEREREIRDIYKKIHPGGVFRTKFPEPKKTPLLLPEEFNGRDLKRVKKLIKNRKKR